MRVYICTPIISRDRDESVVRARVAELTKRLADRGYEAVSHLDTPDKGKWAERVGHNLSLLLESDGILLDCTRKTCRVCKIEETVAKEISGWKSFLTFHTKEEFDYINDKYVI